MFICEYSGKRSEKGQSPVRLVLEVRPRKYVNKFKTKRKIKTKETYGWEIVKEIKVLPKYVDEVESKFGTLDQLVSSVVVVEQSDEDILKEFRR